MIPIIVKYVIITWHLAVLLTDVGLLPSISLQLGLLFAWLQIGPLPHIHILFWQILLSGCEHGSFSPHLHAPRKHLSESREQDIRSPHRSENNEDKSSATHGTKKYLKGYRYWMFLVWPQYFCPINYCRSRSLYHLLTLDNLSNSFRLYLYTFFGTFFLADFKI